jgi:hypothetical protein
MARYKLNRGPRYGETIHLPNTQEVALALALGDIELVTDPQQVAADNNFGPPPAKPITEPHWSTGKTQYGDWCITVRMPSGEVSSYGGPVEKARDGFKRRIWSGAAQDYVLDGPEPPAEIIAEYKALKAAYSAARAREAAENDAAVRAQAGDRR